MPKKSSKTLVFCMKCKGYLLDSVFSIKIFTFKSTSLKDIRNKLMSIIKFKYLKLIKGSLQLIKSNLYS